ncbi:MAG: ATP-dependent helicase, partial [Saprospiraceae bacterium]
PFRPEYIYKRKVKGYKKGDVKESKINEQEDRMAKLRAGAKLFPVYVKRMQERGRYDYEDMILWVLQEFKANEALLRRYQEQYLYFLVDEYQDTNGSQNEIIQQLIDFWENPNIFVVGDDDQAIYEFQGARLKNIMDFYQSHAPDIELVMLKENYRSSQNILDASKSVIDNNDERIIRNIEGLDKNLIASNQKVAASIVRPKIIEYPNQLHEDIAIANKIEQLYKEGFPLNEVAVVYAKHKQARNILKLLEKKRIPYNTKKRVNILDTLLIQNLRVFLEYIYAEHRHPHSGEEYLFKILHFDFIGIPPRDLARLSTYMARHNSRNDFHWRDVIMKPETLKEIGFEDIPSLIRFSDFLDTLLIDFGNLRCLSFLEKLINRSGLLHYSLKHEDKAWRLQVISTFFDFVRRETDKNPRFSVRRLIEVLKNMDDNNLAIGVNKTVSAENGVNFLTAHGSKGLEFQVVFMIDCNQDWQSAGGGNRYKFPLPDTLTLSNETENQLESRRRLFYVAMTRAKEELFISYPKKDNK